MKIFTTTLFNRKPLLRIPGFSGAQLTLRLGTCLLLAMAALDTARGQIFLTNRNANTVVEFNRDGTGGATTLISSGLSNPYGITVSGSNLYVTNAGTNGTDGTVIRYNLDGTGATTLVSGLYNPEGVAVSGSFMYVTSAADGSSNGTVGRYNLDGTLDNTFSLISGLSGSIGLAVSGANLFVANSAGGTVGKYNLDGTGGTTLISGLGGGIPLASAFGIALSGTSLFVDRIASDNISTTIGEYDFNGAVINSDLISHQSNGFGGLALSGTSLFVTFPAYNGFGAYDTTTGTLLSFIPSGSGGPFGIAVNDNIPEPSTYAAIAGVIALGLAAYRRRQRVV